MPYIKGYERQDMHQSIAGLSLNINSVGQLNYAITQLCRNFLATSDKKYADYNSIVGVLESAKLEFYRRAVSIYEDKKRDENGDVY